MCGENSYGMMFGCFNGAYRGHEKAMKAANLIPEQNLWFAVFDFNPPPLDSKDDVNWKLMSQIEEDDTWFPLDDKSITNCCPRIEAGSIPIPSKVRGGSRGLSSLRNGMGPGEDGAYSITAAHQTPQMSRIEVQRRFKQGNTFGSLSESNKAKCVHKTFPSIPASLKETDDEDDTVRTITHPFRKYVMFVKRIPLVCTRLRWLCNIGLVRHATALIGSWFLFLKTLFSQTKGEVEKSNMSCEMNKGL